MEELEMKALEDSTSFQEDGLQVEGDIYASVMEPNKRRKIRGVGLGVKASTLKRGPSRSRNSNQAEVEKLREEVSFMREEREVMLREHEKVREELRLEMQREMQKSRDEMEKNVQVMLRMIVRNTPDKEV